MNRIKDILNIYDSISDFTDPSQMQKKPPPSQIENLWNEYFKTPLDSKIKNENKNFVYDNIAKIKNKLGNINVKNKFKWNANQNLSHHLYFILSKISHHFSGIETNLTSEEINMVKSLVDVKYCLLNKNQRQILYVTMSQIFKLLNDYCSLLGSNYVQPSAPVRHGYAFNPSKTLHNMHFCPCVTDDILESMSKTFSESHLDQMVQCYLGSNFCVCNVRIWKWMEGLNNFAHTDGLPPGTFKLMFFNGDITPNHGCFEALASDQSTVTFQAIGHNVGVLIDPTNVWHRALSPKQGLERDTIELTIMPYLTEEKIFVESGCCTSGPLNPFSDSWKTRIYDPNALLKGNII